MGCKTLGGVHGEQLWGGERVDMVSSQELVDQMLNQGA